MSTYAAGSQSDTSPTTRLDPTSESDAGSRFVRLSAGFGVAFALTQLATMVVMATTVLPLSGSPTDPVLQRSQRMLDAASTYRIANYIFILSGLIVLGFLGAVQTRLRRAEPTGTLATVAVAAGGLIAFVWPFAGVLHDLSLDVATAGGDLQFPGRLGRGGALLAGVLDTPTGVLPGRDRPRFARGRGGTCPTDHRCRSNHSQPHRQCNAGVRRSLSGLGAEHAWL